MFTRLVATTDADIIIIVYVSTTTHSGSDTITINCGAGGVTLTTAVAEFSGVTGVGNFNTPSEASATGSPITFSSSISTSSFSTVFETVLVNDNSGPSSCATDAITALNNQGPTALADCVTFTQFYYYKTFTAQPNQGSNNYGIQVTGGCSVSCKYDNQLLELKGTSSSPTGLGSTTACFGNCGNPAVTLTNTNSTQGSFNFNQSITIFYQFQSNLNGFILNETVNSAKTYSNGQTLGLAIYEAICEVGISPFTPQCIGSLVASTTVLNPAKGRVNLVPNPVPVTSGEWVALAFSAQVSPVAINDTNTSVPIYFANPAGLPFGPTLAPTQLVSQAGCTCKTGIWGFITGNTVIGIPSPVTGGCTNNFAQLDCLIPAMVNGLCSVVSASCQTSTALLWIIILTFLSFLLLTVGFASAHVTKFVAAGDVFMFLFLAWFFIFAGLGVLQSFVVIFFLFIGAVAFGKTARNYF